MGLPTQRKHEAEPQIGLCETNYQVRNAVVKWRNEHRYLLAKSVGSLYYYKTRNSWYPQTPRAKELFP